MQSFPRNRNDSVLRLVLVKFRRIRKAVSPVIAVLLMIAIAVIAAILAYMWVTGYIRFTATKTGKAIQIQSASYTGTHLLVYVQNVGKGTVRFVAGQFMYIDGVLRERASMARDTLQESETVTMADNISLSLGQTIKIKVVTDEGTSVEKYFTVNIFTGDYTLTVIIIGKGSVDPLGGTYFDDTVQLTATPDLHWDFSGWSGGGLSGNANPVNITVDRDMQVTATFEQYEFQVEFGQTGLDGTATGTVVTASIGSDTYEWNFGDLPFSSWVNAGTDVSYSYTTTVQTGTSGEQFALTGVTGPTSPMSVTNDVTITGEYGTRYYLSVTSPYGIAGGEGWYGSGDTAYATLDAGSVDHFNATRHVFTSWTVDSSGASFAQSDAIIMNAPKTAVAAWKTQYSVSFAVSPSGAGTTNPSGDTWYDAGTSNSPISTSTNAGYNFTSWSSSTLDITIADEGEQSTTVTINAPGTITANFVQLEYTLTVNVNPLEGGIVNTNKTEPLYYGDVVELIPSPNAHWGFVGWSGDLTGSNNPAYITIDGAKVVNATFIQTQFQITVTASPPGAVSGTFRVTYTQGGTSYTDVLQTTSWTEWVDANTGVTVSQPQQYIPSETGVGGQRYVFDHYDPAATLTMTGDRTITLVYGIQFRVRFSQSGLDGTATGTVVTVNGAAKAYGDLDFDLWVQPGSQVTYNYGDVSSSVSGERFILNSVTGPLSGFTVSGAVTIVGNYGTQYYLTVTSDHDTPLPTSAWFDAGTPIDASVTSPADVSGPTQYRCLGWTGTGSVPASGTDAYVSFTIYAPSTITWNWVTQYDLWVTSAHDSPTPNGSNNWYDAGTIVNASVTSPADQSGGTQYNCTGWSGTGSVPISGSGTSLSFTITAPSSLTWKWTTQFQITFAQIGVSSDFTGTMVSVNGTNYEVTDLSKSFWCDANSPLTFAFQSSLVVTPDVKQYVWTSTSGLSSLQSDTITVTGSGIVTGNYKTQYYIAVTSAHDSPTSSQWVDQGGSLTASVTSPADIVANDHQWTCTGYSVDGEAPVAGAAYTFTDVQAAHTIVFNWNEQFWVVFAQKWLGTSAYGTVVTVNGTAVDYSSMPYNEWVDSGSSVTYSYTAIVACSTPGKQFVLMDVSGPSSPLTVNSTTTVTGNYKTQYSVTFAVDPSFPVPGITSPSGTQWYDSGTNVSVTATVTNSSYTFSSWSATGSISIASPSSASTTATINSAGTITATFSQNTYIITVNIVGQGSVARNASEPYVYGQVVNLTATPQAGWSFSGWSGDLAGSANPATLTMTANKTVTATFTVVSGPKLVYTGGFSQTLDVGERSSQITVQRQYANGTPMTNGTTTVNLGSSSGSSHFYYRDWLGLYHETSSVTIDSGENSADFYYRDNAAGTPTLTASSSGFTSATTQFAIESQPRYTAAITPTSVGAGTTVSFTYTVALDTDEDVDIGYVNITIPAGFTGISVTSVTSSQGTWLSSVSGNVITLRAHDSGVELEERGDWVRVVFTANAPASTGTYQFPSTVYEHLDLSGLGPGTNTGSDPSVTLYIPVSITITSSPAGPGFVIVDGNAITTPTTFNWEQGSTHSLQANTSVSDGTGVQYVYTGWSDSGAQTHNYIVPSSSATITANYKTQYRLTMAANFGTTIPTVGNTWYDAGSQVTISATAPLAGANEQYIWNGWTGTGSGSYTGTSNPSTNAVTMNAPITETASWMHQYQVTVTASPSGAIGGTFSVTYTQGGVLHSSELRTTTWSDWADATTTVTVSNPQSPVGSYTFSSYDPSSTVTMSTYRTITLVYALPQVTFVSAGTGSGTTSNPTPAYPTGLQANDLILLQVTVRDTSNTPTTPTGFTLLFGPDASGSTVRQWIYYKFATGSESGTITITIGGSNTKMARMYAFRNVALSSFTEGAGFRHANDDVILAQPVTTTGNNRLAVSFIFVSTDESVGSFTGESGGDWTEAVAEFTTTAGYNGLIQLQTATMASAGTISGGSYDMGYSSYYWGVRAFALIPKS